MSHTDAGLWRTTARNELSLESLVGGRSLGNGKVVIALLKTIRGRFSDFVGSPRGKNCPGDLCFDNYQ